MTAQEKSFNKVNTMINALRVMADENPLLNNIRKLIKTTVQLEITSQSEVDPHENIAKVKSWILENAMGDIGLVKRYLKGLSEMCDAKIKHGVRYDDTDENYFYKCTKEIVEELYADLAKKSVHRSTKDKVNTIASIAAPEDTGIDKKLSLSELVQGMELNFGAKNKEEIRLVALLKNYIEFLSVVLVDREIYRHDEKKFKFNDMCFYKIMNDLFDVIEQCKFIGKDEKNNYYNKLITYCEGIASSAHDGVTKAQEKGVYVSTDAFKDIAEILRFEKKNLTFDNPRDLTATSEQNIKWISYWDDYRLKLEKIFYKFTERSAKRSAKGHGAPSISIAESTVKFVDTEGKAKKLNHREEFYVTDSGLKGNRSDAPHPTIGRPH